MPIIGTLPNILMNGTTADASQVMADFNYIVNQVNANGTPTGTLTAPSGTRVAFQQASPPTGWTVDSSAAFTDCSMRVNTGTAGSTGGVTNWSTWNFGGLISLNPFALNISQIPSHSHTIPDPGHTHGTSDPGHVHAITPGSYTFQASAGSSTVFVQSGSTNTQPATTGLSINAALTNITTTNPVGSGSAITPTITTPQVKYADFCIGVKS
jgi:hypothetical protein